MPMTYQEGITAYRQGLKIEDCPYQASDHRYELWRAGWRGEDMVSKKHPPLKKSLSRSDAIARL